MRTQIEKLVADRIRKAKENHVEPDGSMWLWMPQVGGYTAPCRVHTITSDGCFDVDVYHDGEFPEDELFATLHCCAAEQFEEFGRRVREHVEKTR